MTRLETKAEIVADIALLLGVEAPAMSTGSTEPREIFDLCAETLGLDLGRQLTKPELARFIVESAGFAWGVQSESRGGTVTLAGLQRVREAIRLFLAE